MERNLKNAKNELLGLIAASGSEILCAELFYTPSLLWSMDEDNNAPPSKEFSLKANHTEEELQEFLNSLDQISHFSLIIFLSRSVTAFSKSCSYRSC